jgi:hypothetical protein
MRERRAPWRSSASGALLWLWVWLEGNHPEPLDLRSNHCACGSHAWSLLVSPSGRVTGATFPLHAAAGTILVANPLCLAARGCVRGVRRVLTPQAHAASTGGDAQTAEGVARASGV